MQATISTQDISAIAVGTFTEIVSIFTDIVPLAGDQVKVTVAVKNIHTQAVAVTVAAKYDETALYPSPDYLWIDPGTTQPFTISFTMPNKNIRLHVWSFYWTGTEWIDDDYGYIDIVLEEVPPTEGKVQNLEITEWESPVEIGGRCRIQVGFEYMGPETTRVLRAAIGHQYPLWFNEKVYKELTITISERAEIRKSYYFIDIPITAGDIDPAESPFDLYAKVDGIFPEAISPIYEDVITVTAPPVEYTGLIVFCDMYKSPEGQIPFPATVVANNEYFKVFTDCKNTSTVAYVAGVELKVYDPDGILRASPTIDWANIPSNRELEWEYKNFCRVDKEGTWTIEVRFLERDTSAVLAEKTLVMTAVPAFPDPEFQNFAITGYDGVPVDEQLMVIPGQTATVHMTVDYRGRAIDGSIYTAMGWKELWFIPIFSSMTPVRFEASYDFLTYEIDCDVDIKTIDPAAEILYGTLLDMYAKIVGVPGPDIYTPFYTGVIAWSKAIEEYELIQDTIHHFAYIYDGDNETTIVTLKTDPFKPADWVPESLVTELEREAREEGVRILETKVYVDTSPLFWTDYRIEVTGTPSGEVTGVGIGALPAIPLFVKIILGALALAFGILVITWAVKQFLGVFQHKVGLEDVKVAWDKEALILDVHDAEEYWERTLTPIETLEGMSEQELRDILDQIAEEEVPTGPEVPWALVAVGGGLAVLGVGAVALAARRKE